MRGGKGFGARLMSLVLGTAALAAMNSPARVAPSGQGGSAVAAPGSRLQVPMGAPVSAPTSVIQNASMLPARFYRESRYWRPVWNGSAKRGNRRGRERWNYNR